MKDWPAVVTPLACLKCEVEISALAFANNGQWLIVAGNSRKDSELTIWDWQHKQRLYTHKLEHPILHLSCTDRLTPYPCLFKDYTEALYSFDPVKTVAANMLSRVVAQQTTSNNNNSNNVSNDNGPAPTASKETSRQDSDARGPKKPKK